MPENFGSFLTFIGSSAFIGALLSIIAESAGWFQNLSSGQKISVLGVVSLVCGFVSHLAVTYIPAGVVADAEPYYQIVVNSIGILLASKAYHAIAESTAPKTTVIQAKTSTANVGQTITVTVPPTAPVEVPPQG